MILGMTLGPVAHVYLPGWDLLAAGVVGGVAAWLWHLARHRSTPA